MDAFLRSIVARPLLWLAAALLATALALGGLRDPETGGLELAVDPSVGALLAEDDPARRFHERTRELFGSDATVVVALHGDAPVDAGRLAAVERLTPRLAALPGVRRVHSLATVPLVESGAEGVDLRPLTRAAAERPAALPALREAFRANPVYGRRLLSEDGSATALVLVLRDDVSDREYLERGLTRRIRALAAEEAGGARVHVTGAPVVKEATSRALLRELSVILPAIVAVGSGVLLLAFGTLRAVLLAAASISVSLAWTLGALGWLGQALDLVTVIVPPLVVTVGLAYALHVLTEFTRPGEGPPAEPAAEERARRWRRVAGPVAVTGLTTVVGLLALAVNPLAAIRRFALLAAFGVAVTTVASLTLLPALLCLGRERPASHPPFEGALRRAAHALGRFALARRRAVLAAGLGVAVVAAAGVARIQVGTRYVGSFPEDAPVRRDYEAIDRAFAGANSFHVVLEAPVRDAFLQPGLLAELDGLQRWLEARPGVGRSTSLLDLLRLAHHAVAPEEAFRIPEDPGVSKQLLLFGAGDLRPFTDARFQTLDLAVGIHPEDSPSVQALLERVERRLAELPEGVEARVTGTAVLLNRTVDRIAQGQLWSLAAALGAIYLVLAALFSSLRVGLLALLPNALPLLVYFGVLGYGGVWLSPATSLVGCIALGIAVDDTIHYLVRFNDEARRTGSEESGTLRTLRTVLRPVTFTTLAICLGFLLLTTSELRQHVQFGALVALTLAAAWAIDITLTPALVSGVRIVTLWDLLRLDLGPEGARTLPLFAGLSERQARIFALTADIQSYGAGETVRREGEPAEDMFVVLEGRLRVWALRRGRRVELYEGSRGDVVGEIALFNRRHRATLEAATDVRLLRFEDVDLDLMMRRHPRAAARIYRNLNRIQAARLEGAVERIPPAEAEAREG